MYNQWFGAPVHRVPGQPVPPENYVHPAMQVSSPGFLIPVAGYTPMLPTPAYPAPSPYQLPVAPPAPMPQRHEIPNDQPSAGPQQPTFYHHMSQPQPQPDYMLSPQPDFVHVQPVSLQAVVITPLPNPLYANHGYHQHAEIDAPGEIKQLDPNYDDDDELPFRITKTYSEAARQPGPSSSSPIVYRGAVNTAAATYRNSAFTTNGPQVNGDETVHYEPDVGANVTVETEPATVASTSTAAANGMDRAKKPNTTSRKGGQRKSNTRKSKNLKLSTTPK